MGSKNLKAIVFKGDRKRPLFHKEHVRQFSKAIGKESKKNPIVQAFRTMGTPMMVKTTNQAMAFPTKYWSEKN